MRTLYDLGKMQEIQASGRLEIRDHNLSSIEATEKICKLFSPFVECQTLVSLSEYDGKYHFEYSECHIMHSHLTLWIKFWDKKYHIFMKDEHDFKNLQRHEKDKASEGLKVPNKIGVPTKNKVDAWIKYYEQLYVKLSEANEINRAKIRNFMDLIDNPGMRLSCQKYWINKDRTEGQLRRNGIMLKWKIHEGSYVETQLDLDVSYKPEGDRYMIHAFNSLSANKYESSYKS